MQVDLEWHKSSFTLNHIFSDNHNWDTYRFNHKEELREVEIEEVNRMLTCGDKGFRVFTCPKCGEVKVIHFGCNSRMCTHCGKKFADKWAENIARKTFKVKHRHGVLTIPSELRSIFKEERELLKVFMDSAIKAILDVMEWKLHKEVIPGVIAVLHTYGKDMKFNPHIHALITEGGFKNNGEWVDVNVFPYKMLRRAWQYQVLTNLKAALENTLENSRLIDSLFKRHLEGFYVRAKDTITGEKDLIRYIGRYIRHPAIAESRIEFYDGETVGFWYRDDDEVKHHVKMNVEEFISAIIGHIPDRQFKTIRHYGIYSRGLKRHFRGLLGLISIAQQKLTKFFEIWTPTCDKCGTKMEYVITMTGKPPPNHIFGSSITDWNYILPSPTSQ